VRAPESGVRLARSRGPTAKTTTPANDGTRERSASGSSHRPGSYDYTGAVIGLSTAPPAALTTEVLTETVRQACAQALVASPRQPATAGPLTAEPTGREGR
jgi:hypothetical protein